jgi:hypothetical protein
LSRSRLKPLLQCASSDTKTPSNSKGFRLAASYFSLLVQRKVTKRKHTLPSALRANALRVRVHHGDPRKGHPAPAADGAHPCAPPFGCFPAMAAATEGNPVGQKQQPKPKPKPKHSNGRGNSHSHSHGNGARGRLQVVSPAPHPL